MCGEISPFVEESYDELSVDFIKKIVDKMREVDVDVYLRCIQIMTSKTDEELMKLQSLDILEIFIDGLRTNQILSLYKFGRGLRYVS